MHPGRWPDALFELPGRVVLVTGGSGAIGRAVAMELGRAGASVAIHYRTRSEAAESVAASVRGLGAASRTFGADVREPAEVDALVRAAAEWQGHLDGVVTSAGVYRGPRLEEVETSASAEVFRTDLEGSCSTVRASVPWLRQSEHAAVVTLSSVLATHPAIGAAPYQMAKAAVEQMTRTLALELAPRIRVNAVAPGFVRTGVLGAVHDDPASRERIARRTPLGRWGEPEDVAPVVRFLLSPEASWITGSVLGVNGGIALR